MAIRNDSERTPGTTPRGTPLAPPANPTRRRLTLAGQSEIIEQIVTGLGSPVALAYGPHIVGGRLVLQQDVGSDQVVMVYALGEGEWGAQNWLEVNGARVDHTDTAIVHFHPGLDGEAGTETTPGVRNQKLCSLLPTDFSPATHWPRTAYLVLKMSFDPESPTDGFTVRGSYNCLRVRQFDNTGAQTAYSFSTNPAWCALDAILRGYLKPRSAINEALTAAEKARFDWPAWKDWADACDVAVGGEDRWQSNLPFVDQSDLRAAIDWFLLVGRAYLVEKDGKLAPFHDETRASAATYDESDLLPGSLNLARRSVRNRPNRHSVAYRDLNSGVGPGTISTSGTTLTGTGTDFIRRFQLEKMLRLTDGTEEGEVRSILSVSDDTNAVLDEAFSSDQSGTAYESPNDAYQSQTRTFDDESHQDDVGRILDQRIDLGNTTPTRAERTVAYIRARAGLSKLISGRLGLGVPSALDHLPGDLVTLPSGQDFADTQVTELLEVTIEPDFSLTFAGIEYDAAIFVDTAGDQELPVPVLPGDSKFTRVDQDRYSGAQLAFDNIKSGGEYLAEKWHNSGYENEDTTDHNTNGTEADVSWIDGASFTIDAKPLGETEFAGSLRVSRTGASATWTVEGRLKVNDGSGDKFSNVISISNPVGILTATATVTGLSTARVGLTITVQLQVPASPGITNATVKFTETQSTSVRPS